MSAPQWSPVDDTTCDLLALVATGPMAPDTADREWDTYERALRYCAEQDAGLIQPNRLRELVREHVAPRRIGAFCNRAVSRGLIEATGEWQVSDDTEGRNAGRPMRVYRWIGAPS